MSRPPGGAVADGGRLLQRYLGVNGGTLACPRRGSIDAITCDDCPFLCGREAELATVICSYPLPALETFARRSRRNHAVRIALGHCLERT
jgi:hypothetical protein